MHDPKRVVVIGCGGIGGHLVRALAPAFEFQAAGSSIILIDGDSYEPKNAERQTFSQIGNKAQVLRLDVSPRFPNTIIIAKAAWIVEEGQQTSDTKEEGISKLAPSEVLKEDDHVFVLVDNNAARKIVFDAARSFKNIDVYTAGNGTLEDGEALFATSYHYIRRDDEDVTLNPIEIHPELANPKEKNPGSMSCEERAKIDGGTQTIAANMAAATLLVSKASQYILGTPEQAAVAMKMVEVYCDLADYSMRAETEWLVKPQSIEPELVSAASSQNI